MKAVLAGSSHEPCGDLLTGHNAATRAIVSKPFIKPRQSLSLNGPLGMRVSATTLTPKLMHMPQNSVKKIVITEFLLMQVVMDWLGKLLGLPQKFLSRTPEGSLQAGGGVIQGTASEAALVCMLAARARALQDRPTTDMTKLVAYTSDQVLVLRNSSAKQAAMLSDAILLRVLFHFHSYKV